MSLEVVEALLVGRSHRRNRRIGANGAQPKMLHAAVCRVEKVGKVHHLPPSDFSEPEGEASRGGESATPVETL